MARQQNGVMIASGGDKNKKGLKGLFENIEGKVKKVDDRKWKYMDMVSNFVAMAYFFVVAVALLVVSLVLNSPDFYGEFILVGPNVTAKAPVEIVVNSWRIPLFQMLCIIPFVDCISHMVSAVMARVSPDIYFGRWLSKRFHPLRWFQYSLSWSFMNLTLNIILFQGNPQALTADFIDTFVINILGLFTEYMDSVDSNTRGENPTLKSYRGIEKFMFWLPFNLGCLLYFRILCTRFSLLITDAILIPKIPWEAWLTFFFLIFTEAIFVVILILSIKRVSFFKNYYLTSFVYTLNSIVGKSVFVFVLAGGIWGSSKAFSPN